MLGDKIETKIEGFVWEANYVTQILKSDLDGSPFTSRS